MQKLRLLQLKDKSQSGSSLKSGKSILSRRNSLEGLEQRCRRTEKDRMKKVLKEKSRKIEKLKEKKSELCLKLEEYLHKAKKCQVLQGISQRKDEQIREIKQSMEIGKVPFLILDENDRIFKGKNRLHWKIKSPKMRIRKDSLTGRKSGKTSSPDHMTDTAERQAKLKSLFDKASAVLGGWKKSVNY